MTIHEEQRGAGRARDTATPVTQSATTETGIVILFAAVDVSVGADAVCM